MVGRDGWSVCVGREGKEGGRMDGGVGRVFEEGSTREGRRGVQSGAGSGLRGVRRGLWVLSVYFEHEAQIVYRGVGRVSCEAAEEDGTAGTGGIPAGRG